MEEFGILAPIVTGAGQIMAAAIALFAIVSGKSLWAPTVPGLPNYAVRIFGLVAGVGVVTMYLMRQSGVGTSTFSFIAGCFVVVGLLGSILYLFLRMFLCFYCEGDQALYVRGLKLKVPAKKVLGGQLEGPPPQYDLHGQPGPTSQREYFCRSGKNPEFIWEEWSIALAQVLIFAIYGFAMVPLTLALASGSIALGLQ